MPLSPAELQWRQDPVSMGVPDATVLVCTFNRAGRLGEALDSLARTDAASLAWEVVVVDNNSTDSTRAAVLSRIDAYPVPLRYLFEPRQGKSCALNTGLAASAGAIVAFTDDDVRVTPGWLRAACEPILRDGGIDYTGGPVLPIWEGPPPSWLDSRPSDLWGTLAILDYGHEPFVFEERRRIPLGANMAARRSLIAQIGGFDPELGRRGESLLGQEQAEFFCRTRARGARGMYVPEMALEHHVPASRLTRGYFRRWWFWKGVSRAVMANRHPVTELGIDLTQVRRIGGVPRFMVGQALRNVRGWVRSLIRGEPIDRARHEMMLCYFAGYVRAEYARRTAAGRTGTGGEGVPTVV